MINRKKLLGLTFAAAMVVGGAGILHAISVKAAVTQPTENTFRIESDEDFKAAMAQAQDGVTIILGEKTMPIYHVSLEENEFPGIKNISFVSDQESSILSDAQFPGRNITVDLRDGNQSLFSFYDGFSANSLTVYGDGFQEGENGERVYTDEIDCESINAGFSVNGVSIRDYWGSPGNVALKDSVLHHMGFEISGNLTLDNSLIVRDESWKYNEATVGGKIYLLNGSDANDTKGEIVTDSPAPVTPVTPDKPETPVKPSTPVVTSVQAKSIKITADTKKMAQGKKIQLTATVLPENAADKKVTWTSSNTKVASVDSKGTVTATKKAGGKSVVITATCGNVKQTYKISVVKGVVKKVSISGKNSVKAGKTLKLKAKVKATKKACKAVKWTSSNINYATVSAKGVVKATKAGKGKTVKITAAAVDGSGKKAVKKIKIK